MPLSYAMYMCMCLWYMHAPSTDDWPTRLSITAGRTFPHLPLSLKCKPYSVFFFFFSLKSLRFTDAVLFPATAVVSFPGGCVLAG